MEREIMIKPTPFSYRLDTAGMSLIEVSVAVGLILLVVGAGIIPYITQQEYLKQQFAISRLQDEVSIAMSYISRDIYNSKTVDSSGFPTRISLTVGTGPLQTDETAVSYRLSGADIQRRVGSGSWAGIAANIRSGDGLQFGITGNNCINITITGQSGGLTTSVTSTTALRAIVAA